MPFWLSTPDMIKFEKFTILKEFSEKRRNGGSRWLEYYGIRDNLHTSINK